MKVAILAPVYAPIFEKVDFGGAEWFVKTLGKGLQERGHKITIFASEDSDIKGVPIYKLPFESKEVKRSVSLGRLHGDSDPGFDPTNELFIQAQLFLTLRKVEGDFDIIHNDSPNWFSLFCGSGLHTPFVTRLHTTVVQDELKALFTAGSFENFHLVANSYSTAKIYQGAGLPVETTIPNGLAFKEIPWSESKGSYLVWAGRLMPYKGTHLAIEVARGVGLPLKVAGRIQDKEYFEQKIKPYLSDKIEYVGFLDRPKVFELMSHAICFLQTSLVQESFGLITLESLATGTPVIGFNLGATPEIVVDGKVGFIVDKEDLEGMCDRVGKIDAISRSYCRQYSETTFPLKKMITSHEEYFEGLVSRSLGLQGKK